MRGMSMVWRAVMLVVALGCGRPASAERVAPGQDPVPLGLEEAVRRTVTTHPAGDGATAELDLREAVLRGARSSRLPRLSVEAGGTRFQEPMIVAPLHGFDPQAPPEFDRTLVQGRAVAAYTLFDGGVRGARIREARAAVDAAGAGAAEAMAMLIERSVGAYVAVGAAREILAANAARVAALEEERSRSERLLAAGSVPQVAVLRAEAALASARADHAAALAQLRRAGADLARLIGTDADSIAAFALESVTLPDQAAEPDRVMLIEAAVQNNPAVERARAQLSAADAAVAGSRSSFWPVLAVNGGYNVFGSAAGDWIGEWQAAVQLAYPLFTGGERAAAVDRSLAGVDAATAALALARLGAAAEVDAGLARLAGARAQVRALRTAVEQFAAVVDIEALSLSAGAGVQPDYLRAVSDLLDARAGLTRARTEEVVARVALARTAGDLNARWLVTSLEVE